MPAAMRVQAFTRNVAAHLMILASFGVVQANNVILDQGKSPGVLLALFCVLAMVVGRVKLASMPDQALACAYAGRAWAAHLVLVFAAATIRPALDTDLIHAFSTPEQFWAGMAVAFAAALCGYVNAAFELPGEHAVSCARAWVPGCVILKCLAVRTVQYAGFWTTFLCILETAYYAAVGHFEALGAMGTRNEQLRGEKERMGFELALQDRLLHGADRSAWRGPADGTLGAMQDPKATAKQQDAAVAERDAHSVKGRDVPLFTLGPNSPVKGALVPQRVRQPLPEAASASGGPPSVSSSMMRAAPSMVDSSVVLPPGEALERRGNVTWAPCMLPPTPAHLRHRRHPKSAASV